MWLPGFLVEPGTSGVRPNWPTGGLNVAKTKKKKKTAAPVNSVYTTISGSFKNPFPKAIPMGRAEVGRGPRSQLKIGPFNAIRRKI